HRLGVFLAHSGGSSPKTRRQISAATREVATEDSAPSPASSPAHISRLTISLSVMRGSLSAKAVADRSDDVVLGPLVRLFALVERAEDPAGQDLLDRAVEGHGRELGADRVAELA